MDNDEFSPERRKAIEKIWVEHSKQSADSRRFWLTLIVVLFSFGLIFTAMQLDAAREGSNFLSVLLPVLSSIIAGAIGAYLGKEITLKKRSADSSDDDRSKE